MNALCNKRKWGAQICTVMKFNCAFWRLALTGPARTRKGERKKRRERKRESKGGKKGRTGPEVVQCSMQHSLSRLMKRVYMTKRTRVISTTPRGALNHSHNTLTQPKQHTPHGITLRMQATPSHTVCRSQLVLKAACFSKMKFISLSLIKILLKPPKGKNTL